MNSSSVLVSVILGGALLSGCGATDSAPSSDPSSAGSTTPSATADPTVVASPTAPTTQSSPVQKPAVTLDLTIGWPDPRSHSDGEITRPELSARELIATGCTQQALRTTSPHTGQALEFLGPEDSRKRQVLRFADPADARATVAGIVSEMRSCPTRDQDGATAISQVDPRPGGIVVTTHYTYDGELAVGAASLVALRNGSVVVLSSMASEASGAEGARLLADLDLPRARAILSQACAAKGC